jgi:L-ribulose-5-phosphate 3-epimerase
MDRRQFLGSVAAAMAPPAGGELRTRPILCLSTESFAGVELKHLAQKAKEIGFEGIDLHVHAQAHVVPEKVAQDLPKAFEIIRAAGLEVPMITTELKNSGEPSARPTLEAMRNLGIRFYRPGYWRYTDEFPVLQTLVHARREFRSLFDLNRRVGACAGLHNHSGNYVGSDCWEVREMLLDLDPRWAGHYFDPAHATMEGAVNGWKTCMELAVPRLKMVAVKDAVLERDKKDGRWHPRWMPLGDGMVEWSVVIQALARGHFTGPLSVQLSYQTKDRFEAIAKDLAAIRKVVAGAYAPPPQGLTRQRDKMVASS